MADVENLEFKSPEDDAWYRVSIKFGRNREGQLEGPAYFDVHYESGHRRGQVYSVNLNDSNLIEETRARFRCESTQLQDSQHCELQWVRAICAAYRNDLYYFDASSKHNNDLHYSDANSNHNNDFRYFDATVKEIGLTKYTTRLNTSSKFTSSAVTFTVAAEVLWEDGPSKGEVTVVPVNDMRLLSHGRIEARPAIQFLERALRENKKKASVDVKEARNPPDKAPVVPRAHNPNLSVPNVPVKAPLVRVHLDLRLSAPLAHNPNLSVLNVPVKASLDLNVPVDLEDD